MSNIFPDGLGPCTMEERERFYRDLFDVGVLETVADVVGRLHLAVDVGSDTTRYRPRFKKHKGEIVWFDDTTTVEGCVDELELYRPEDVYMDTYVYPVETQQPNPVWERPEGSLLTFSLRPDDVDCERCTRFRKRGEDRLSQFAFCESCFGETAENARELHKFLSRTFDRVMSFSTGRGFDVHVWDEEAVTMDSWDRTTLADKILKRFPIRRDVTAGSERKIRLPGSLNGVVGREVVPVTPDQMKEPVMILEEHSDPFGKERE